MDDDTDDTRADLRFQDGLQLLDDIVERLESGELPLEEALRAFEEGVKLVRLLNQKLGEAERRVEVLSRAEDGGARLQAWKDDQK